MSKDNTEHLTEFRNSADGIRRLTKASHILLQKEAADFACDKSWLGDLLSALKDTQNIVTEAEDVALPFLSKSRKYGLKEIDQMYLSYNALFNRLGGAKYAANALFDKSAKEHEGAVFITVIAWIELCYYFLAVMLNFIETELLKIYPITGPFPYRGHVGDAPDRE